MFSHPVAGFGKVCILGGILFAGVAFSMRPDQASLLFILSGILESLGFFFLLLGVIAQGFLRIERHLAGIPEMKVAFEASEPKTAARGNPYQRKDEQK
ncbi:hypothetical protein [Sinorhizobium alkalisoli]|uniref:hypothetical protein n=1 Tax=Sinorhizobium alkalisoli TaxID=1752398 RepID=UPI00124D8E0D|nr:hypothetical protein [Sinorhizobium alkalisoli]QFI65567.1 hypothetical protein EKH55_0693 [Sinorhizobium alkalisoli]